MSPTRLVLCRVYEQGHVFYISSVLEALRIVTYSASLVVTVRQLCILCNELGLEVISFRI